MPEGLLWPMTLYAHEANVTPSDGLTKLRGGVFLEGTLYKHR